MNKLTKILTVLLATFMVFAMNTTTFAIQEGEMVGGSITIDNAVVDQTYSVYQILYLESYSTDNEGHATGAYAYKANSAWEEWLKTQTEYVKIDTQGYVTWITITKETSGYESATDVELETANDAAVAAFAKAAQAYAEQQKMTSDSAAIKATSTEVKFENLKLGYYLVDSTTGTLCSLDTTNPDVTIKEKNVAPSNEKKVEEDRNYGNSNDAGIGDTVNFQSTITAQAGAENYVFHDKMSDGLTFGSVTEITLNDTAVADSNYTVKTSDLEDNDPCTFHVEFNQDFCDTLKANDKIVISYTATVNENAVVGSDGNKNESYLKYGEKNDMTTTPSETKTYTWDVGVYKYAMDDNDEKPLAGATFTLSKKDNGTDPIALVVEDNNVYRVATKDDTNTVTEITTDSTGKFTIKGLDSGTYYLSETAAPAGYNKLSEPITVTITHKTDDNNTHKGEISIKGDEVAEVKVLNQTGSELPSTGGMGTTIFYALGTILVIGAGVVFVVRRRMDSEK